MKTFAVIGDPIAHSLSPTIHNEVFRQLNLIASFDKIHIHPDNLHSFINSNELDGFNVTIPHKQSVIPFLNKLDESAKIIGAVNCVHNGKGFNTDWIGFLIAMDLNHIELKGKNCLILGAGGAARAIAFALANNGVKSISIKNRTQEKAAQLLDWVQSFYPNPTSTDDPDIVINCTPVGMWPDTELMPDFDITPNQVLVDTIYNPIETAWLKAGQKFGAKTVGGLDMFIAQGLASADIWFNDKISERIKLEPIKKELDTVLC